MKSSYKRQKSVGAFLEHAAVYAAATTEAEPPTEPASGTLAGTDISWEVAPDEGAEWDLNKTGQPFKLTLKGSGDMPEYLPADTSKKTKFPWYDHRSYITSVTIEEGITSIGSYSFFRHYPSLKSITLPAIELPDSLRTIGESAFFQAAVTTLTIPENLESIAEGAFYQTEKLNNITVKEGNTHFKVDSKILYTLTEEGTPHVAFLYPMAYNVVEDKTILDGTERIAKYAFYKSKVRAVTFPDTLKTIGQWAFAESGSLKSVNFKEGITTIEGSAFSR